MSFCVTKLVQYVTEKTSPHIEISLLFFFWHHWDDRIKHSKFFDWKMLWKYKKIFNLPFTYYSTAQPKIVFCFPLYKAQQQWQKNSVVFVDQLSKPSVCSGLWQVSLGSGKCLHPAHSPLPVLPHLAPWLCGDPSPILCPRNSLFNLEVLLSAASPCCSCKT